jgi:hypothetical protein
VLVMGLWRTGTTLLHELLADVDGLIAPTSWQCLRPASFRLVPPRAQAQAVRPMDGLTVTTSSPQEDEFALLLQGAPSLYQGFLDPRRLPELSGLLEGGDRDFLADWLPFLASVQAGAPGRLLLKSPNHLFRLETIRAVFADAPIIVTLRDPIESWWSNVRMWTEMAALHGHWSTPPGTIETFVTNALRCAAVHLEQLATAPPQHMAICRFEALAADPAAEALRIVSALGLPFGPADAERLRAAAARRGAHRTRSPRDPVPPAARDAVAQLASAQGRFRD